MSDADWKLLQDAMLRANANALDAKRARAAEQARKDQQERAKHLG